ncbi:MAG: hypothetical protein M0030_12625, partial [Actinomycetota bacterium]|nr:hypothetical protein [Actinomycetota bacterium]
STEQCRAAAHARYTAAVRAAASPADADAILADTDRLWRAVQNAELAGLDGAHVIRTAITGRPFTGARSHSAVLCGRITDATGHLPPATPDTWTAALPRFTDPDTARYMTSVAAAMDDRQRRIGEHTARHAPLWATRALGPAPDNPAQRAEWEAKAGRIGAYREITGWDHPADPIGPEPPPSSPEARARWHAALAVMARVDGIDVRHLSDGQLHARRRAYQAETAWAPHHVAEELRAATRQEQHSRIEATRHAFEAAAAARRGHHDQAALHHDATGSWEALGQRATQIRELLAQAHDTRCQWEAITEPTRRIARAADIELHRRGILAPGDQLVTAEPGGFKYPQQKETAQVWVQPRLDGTISLPRHPEPEPLDPAGREQRALDVLGLTYRHDRQAELPLQVTEIASYNRQRQADIDERRSMRIPAEEPGQPDLGQAWSVLAEYHRDAVLQPPKPPIPAAQAVLGHAAEREAAG